MDIVASRSIRNGTPSGLSEGLRKGVVEQVGTPLELYSKPANLFVAGFIGSLRMNFLKGRIAGGNGKGSELTLESGQTLKTDFPNQHVADTPVTVGIRPADLACVNAGEGLIRGEVQVAEQLGGETFIYVALPGEAAITVELKGQVPVQPGELLELGFANNNFHVFGPDEQVIRHA